MSEPEDLETGEGRDIAVIGMSGRFPRARDLAELWRNLRDGVEAVTFFSDEELAAAGVPREQYEHPRYVKAGSVLEGVDLFDASFFGYNAREAGIMDPQQRLFLEHAWAALEDAGYVPDRYEGLIGVYAGVAWNTYLLSNLTSNRELFDGGGGFQVFITNDKDFMPTRVSYKLNLKGPSVVVQTSCSTSLVAVHLACLSLLNYECDMALVGGVTVKVPQVEGYFFHEGGLASPDGHCRSFDARAAGTIFGSGIGMVVLKRLAEAIEDGDRVRAVIKGSAINNDGSLKVSYTAPSVEGQAGVIAAAHAMAGVDVESIRYIEAHGTGTSLGDPIEVTALTKVFRESTEEKGFCAIGSIKSNVGHLDAAAGIAGFIKTVLAMENRQIPPSLNYERPNPAIDFEGSPFFVATELRDWEVAGDAPRRAGVSSFGVGGTNAHVVLEEAPEPEASGVARPWQLLLLSARSDAALETATANLRFRLEEDESPLADIAWTLATGRTVFRHRRALVCRDRAEALELLADPARLLAATDAEDPRDRPVVFLFSGQGSQYPGMGRELYETEPVFRQEVDRCAELLRPRLGVDLRTVLFPAPGGEEEAARRLEQTALTQPALFTIEYALARLWMSWGVQPAAMLGHSIGEYVAACLAGVFELPDALALVAARGRLIQELPAGAMLSVPLPEEELAPLLGSRISPLSIAAVNEPSRTVVSGPFDAVEELERTLAGRSVESRRLHTSHAFHSPMMEPALAPFTAEVAKLKLQAPQIPFVSDVTGTWIAPEQATDPGYWARHIRQPVRFAAGVAELLRDPRRVLLEVGPGRTLATLASRHPDRASQPVLASMRHPQDEGSDLRLLLEALGRLWLAGLEIDWKLFYAGQRRLRVPLPTYPFERQRFWIEPKALAAVSAGAAVTGTPTKATDISTWFHLPSWKPALPPASLEEAPRRWLVLAHPSGPSARLAERLAQGGREVTVVHPGEDVAARLAELRVEAVVHAWALGGDVSPADDPAGFEAAQELGFHSLLAVARALGRQTAPASLTVVADGLAAITAAEASRPEKATLLGLIRVLPQEMPHVTCRAVDVALPEPGSRETALLDRVVAEALSGANDDLVALRGRERWVPDHQPVRLEGGAAAPLREGGVYLLTGGLEGNGYALARWLAREARARLVLVRDGGEGGDRVQALKELGAEVLIVNADPGEEEEMRRALAEAEARFGPLHGVIHAASTQGERTFRVIAELGPEESGWHFRPKAHALYVLERVLAGRELDFCVVLSSLASQLGGVAYAAYTAAHLFMDAFVREHNRRSEGRPWLAVGWDVWQFEDEAEQILAVREELADLAMTPREGEEAFQRVLAMPAVDQVLVSTGDLGARLAQRRERIAALRGRSVRTADAAPVALHPRPLQTPYVAPENEMERRIAGVWQRTLGFEQIGVHDNFFELGGDSFVAIQVVTRLKEDLGIELPVARLYQGLTIRALAGLLEDEGSAAEQRAAQLEERRESMDRRREFLERRRSMKKSEVS